MVTMQTKDRRFFEFMLIGVAIATTTVFYAMDGYRMVALNLFFLPVVLVAYFLGRSTAGALAVFCVLCVTTASSLDPTGFTGYNSPITLGIALTVWGATLGLTAILVGTLCDDRARKITELHEAYVGVVEVLSKYLQSGNQKVTAQSTRVVTLCQGVANEMNLPQKLVDDIRVGALLYDLGNVEITTKLIAKAVDSVEASRGAPAEHTFIGVDLAHSLGTVLHGAVPLLMEQDEAVRSCLSNDSKSSADASPVGGRIIRAVRAYDLLVRDRSGESARTAQQAIKELANDASAAYGTAVLDSLERVVGQEENASQLDPAYA